MLIDNQDDLADNHQGTSAETPLKKDAFVLSNVEKTLLNEGKIQEVLEILGMDLTDDSMSGTPRRVAKMFVNEIFSGLDTKNNP